MLASKDFTVVKTVTSSGSQSVDHWIKASYSSNLASLRSVCKFETFVSFYIHGLLILGESSKF